MASPRPLSPPRSPNGLNDLLTCPICLDGFKLPKTLSCLHTFCSSCLENCRRLYRRDICCPVCKKITNLPPIGVQGLQNDFRIQQIRDILLCNTEEENNGAAAANSEGKLCDLCKSQKRRTDANNHCIQCYMFFCNPCTEKHNNNSLFSSHHVINMTDTLASDVLFCRSHVDHPVRFFCKSCSLMLCTICTMDHDTSHAPEPLEKGIIEKYRKELKKSLKTIASKLKEVKSKTKYLQTVKQSYQKSQQEAQLAIKQQTEEIITKIREQERKLLEEVQQKIEGKMKQHGIGNLGEITFHRNNIESLCSDIENVIQGSPQKCLTAYEDLITRMKTVSEASLPTVPKNQSNYIVRFVPAPVNNLKLVIGSLEECSISGESKDMKEEAAYPGIVPVSLFGGPSSPSLGRTSRSNEFNSPASPDTSGIDGGTSPVLFSGRGRTVPRRVSSILSALSPNRDVKMGKVKAFNPASKDKLSSPSSPKAINAEELVGSTSSESDDFGMSSGAGAAAGASPRVSSPTAYASFDDTALVSPKPRLIFKVDQVGGWPGKIMSPTSIAFLLDGSVIVSECENRLQVFDTMGNSVRIIGWGKIRPQGVAVTRDGTIMMTDKKDRVVKVFAADGGECVRSWGTGVFEAPSGIAVCASGNIAVTDVDRHTVSIHRPDGSLLTMFGAWGSGDYQFNGPAYLAVDQKDNLIVSDTCNGCIKIFDKTGVFLRKAVFQSGKQLNLLRPQGVAVDKNGNIWACDRDSHRITMFNSEGRFLRHVLSKQDGLRYPCDITLGQDDHVAIVESHSGFLTKDPHHAVKLFRL